MKKVITLALGFIVLSMQAQLPTYVPSNGLVAYYPFSGNTNDISGSSNNGTAYGAVLTTDRFGKENGAYYFNGNSDVRINLKSISNKFASNSGLTVNAWVQTEDLRGPVVSFRNIATSITEFNIGTLSDVLKKDGFIGVQIRDDNTCCGQGNYSYGSKVNDGNWHMLTLSRIADSGGIIKIYVDGILVSTSGASQSGSLTFTDDYISIGSEQSWIKYNWNMVTTDDKYLTGKLDDVGVWNRSLTEDEIKNLYDANICYANITVTDTLVINIGLLSVNPVTYKNTITIAPNPAKDQITIDCGNLETVTGYQIKIINSLGQQVFTTPMNQQKFTIPLNTWSGTGLYFVHIVDAQGHTIDIKKIILE